MPRPLPAYRRLVPVLVLAGLAALPARATPIPQIAAPQIAAPPGAAPLVRPDAQPPRADARPPRRAPRPAADPPGSESLWFVGVFQ